MSTFFDALEHLANAVGHIARAGDAADAQRAEERAARREGSPKSRRRFKTSADGSGAGSRTAAGSGGGSTAFAGPETGPGSPPTDGSCCIARRPGK